MIGGSGSCKTNVLLNLIKYWQNLFVFQRSIQMKLSISYQWKRRSRDYRTTNPKALSCYSQTIVHA